MIFKPAKTKPMQKTSELKINLSFGKPHSLILTEESLNALPARIKKQVNATRIICLTQENIAQHYFDRFKNSFAAHEIELSLITLPDGDAAKSLDVITYIWNQLVSLQVDRSTPVMALGGGSVTDAAGFVAATFHRGLPLVLIPTTLLAQADSSIGGKTGINFNRVKNAIGLFHTPDFIYCNTHFLNTLPERDFCSGMAEIIKMGLIADQEMYQQLKQSDSNLKADRIFRLLERAICHKIAIVEKDPYDEKNIRAKLNFGHTVGHALEAAAQPGQLTHGEAIAIGMATESQIAFQLGYTSQDVVTNIKALLKHFGLPSQLPKNGNWLDFIQNDKKKKRDDISFIFLQKIGAAQVAELSLTELHHIAKQLI